MTRTSCPAVRHFNNITIGQDAGTLTSRTPASAARPAGSASRRTGVTIDNLQQHTWLTTAGTFTLPGFSLSFGNACY